MTYAVPALGPRYLSDARISSEGRLRSPRSESLKIGYLDMDRAPGFPSLFSAGNLATAPGGHGTEYGIPVPTLTKPEEAQAWVDARIAEGSDYIKAVLDDSLEYGVPKPIPTLSPSTKNLGGGPRRQRLRCRP